MTGNTFLKNKKNKPLLQVLAFIILLAAADIITGSILKYFYTRQSSGWDYATRYAAEETKAEVLIMGASRAQQQYNPLMIQDSLQLTCYNAGRDGMSFLYHYAILQAVLKRYTPKIIVLDCEYQCMEKNKTSYERTTPLLPLYRDHPEIRPVVNLRGPFEKYKFISSVYPYNSMLFRIAIGNLSAGKKDHEDIQGYVPLRGSLAHAVKTYDLTKPYELDSIKLNMLNMFITDCKKRNIRLYLVASPYFMKTTGMDHSLAATQKIATEKNVSFIDYSKDTFYYNRPQLFDDTVHLNITGAQIFSSSIASMLKQELRK